MGCPAYEVMNIVLIAINKTVGKVLAQLAWSQNLHVYTA